MFSEILDGVTNKLYEYYDYEVTSENIKQGFKVPSFYLELIKPLRNDLLDNRQHREYPLSVKYFSNGTEDMYTMGDNLMEILHYITVGNRLLRGVNIEYQVLDGVLHFYVTYKIHLDYDVDNEEKMKSVNVKIGSDL